MLYPFFERAGRSISRQHTLRQLSCVHLLVICGAVLIYGLSPSMSLFAVLGHALIVTGIVEGAIVLGWRLTQLPKSRSLELLLLSPISPRLVMFAEQLVGLSYLVLLTMSSLPMLAWLVGRSWLEPADAVLLMIFEFTWGCVTGLGLIWWAYEPLSVRRWGGRFGMLGVLIYLVVGLLVGEKTFPMLDSLPMDLGLWIKESFLFVHYNNPFALVFRIGNPGNPLSVDADVWSAEFALVFRIGNLGEKGILSSVLLTEGIALALCVLFLARSAFRLKGHYIERHYRPFSELGRRLDRKIGERPLSWWAVRRVHEYAGRINLYLACGASLLYSVYLLASDRWPPWMGRQIFRVFELGGGVSGLSTILVLLAAVPAAYQYGLWDSNIPDRCKRLELLLMTELSASDYRRASWAAAWSRGRGYFLAAIVLWFAGWASNDYSNPYSIWQACLALISGMALIGFYFGIGFRCFAGNRGGTVLGFLLTVVMPLATWGLGSSGFIEAARLLPPGMVFYATRPSEHPVIGGMALLVLLAVTGFVLYRAHANFDEEIRSWYDQNHGKR